MTTLIYHVKHECADYPHMPDEKIEAAVQYYAEWASTAELVDQFDDPPEKWIALLKLWRMPTARENKQ